MNESYDMWRVGEMMEGRKSSYLRFIYDCVNQWCREKWCARYDHDWQDCSTAGPDSGNMDMYCRRCGFGFHHQLY